MHEIGTRVRLRSAAPGHENVCGEVIEHGKSNPQLRGLTGAGTPCLVRWDGYDKDVWYLEDDLLPLMP